MSNRCVEPFSLRTAPAGNKVARRFPWWQSGVWTNVLGDAVATGKQIRFRVPGPRVPYVAGAAPLYNNPQPWPIHITEVRFLLTQYFPSGAAGLYAPDLEDPLRKVGAKIKTTAQGDVLKEFVPVSCLATHSDYAQEFETTSATFTLPADYFLPSDADFGADLDIFSTGVFSSDADLQLGIRGCDPYNGSPVARFSEVQSVTYDANKAGNDFTISGTAGGQSLRNMWMRDLTFSLNGPFNSTLTDYGFFWHQTLLKVSPPQGPKWTSDIVTPVSMVMDQGPLNRSHALAADGAGMRSSWVSHKPITPYPMLPQDRFDVECIFNNDLSYAQTDYTTIFFVTLKGYQEVPSDAI